MTSLRHRILDWQVSKHGEVTSTMDLAAELARCGAPAGTIVTAEHQTNGRGQHGRVWLAPYGTCLLATVLLRPALGVAVRPDLSRAIAEKVAEAVESAAGLHTNIKDPNDLLVGGRKLCGILCQSSIRGDQLEHLLVGIGLNVNVAAEDLPLESATSLYVETGVEHARDLLLFTILDHLREIPGLCDGVPARSTS
jgi:BirA family biotin operon repressor/biotin-[acetyl-CoA-carboxylase] ligase